MSKSSRRSRRSQPPPGRTQPTATTPSASSGGRTSSSPTGTPRAGRRERVRPYGRPSIVERYRSVIIGLAVVVVIAVVGGFVFLSASAPTYACSSEWLPEPTASPAPGATARLGYVQQDLGRSHATGMIRYTLCPPASGPHYNITGLGPIRAGVYGPGDGASPTGWVHNLEHGGLVVLYTCDGTDACTDAGQAAFREFYASFPNSPICGIAPGGIFGPVIARFDQMTFPYAALVWGRVLPLDAWDPDAVLRFYETEGERTNPEITPGCSRSSPSPEPSGSESPGTETPSPSAS